MKKRLIALMLATTMATTPVVLTGCDGRMDFAQIAVDLSNETDNVILDVPSFVMKTTDDAYLLTFIGHSATSGNSEAGYLDHKDYLVTYSLSKEDYFELYKICLEKDFFDINYNINQSYQFSDTFLTIKPLIDEIIENYDPISVEEVVMNNDHNYSNFKNNTDLSI